MHDSRIVDKDVNLPELLGQGGNKVAHFLWVADIQLDGKNLDTIADLLRDLRRDLLQCVDAARGKDQLQVLGRRTGELLGSALSNAR